MEAEVAATRKEVVKQAEATRKQIAEARGDAKRNHDTMMERTSIIAPVVDDVCEARL